MELEAMFNTYEQERHVLLDRIIHQLKSDHRVVAAWLFGSLGHEQADQLSDIDIWVVIEDQYAQSIVVNRCQFTEGVAKPILIVESPQYAPKNGAYLMVHYDDTTAPHQVDWYIQPKTLAQVPPDTLLLFDHVGIPKTPHPLIFTEDPPIPEFSDNPYHFIQRFWAMWILMVKYTARYPSSEKMSFLPVCLKWFHKAQRYLGDDDLLWSGDLQPPQQVIDEKLEVLHKLATDMQSMMDQTAQRGIDMPYQFIPGAYRFLKFAETRASSM